MRRIPRKVEDTGVEDSERFCPECERFEECELYPDRVIECAWLNDAFVYAIAVWEPLSGNHQIFDVVPLGGRRIG